MIHDIFAQQHRDILRIAGKIEDQFTSGKIENPYTLRSLLSNMLGKLKVHLDMERACFDQRLLKSINKDSSDMAHKQEMENFNTEVKNYSRKWSAPSTIGEEPHNFIEETYLLFSRFRSLGKTQGQN